MDVLQIITYYENYLNNYICARRKIMPSCKKNK